jgi:hypothetical protein
VAESIVCSPRRSNSDKALSYRKPKAIIRFNAGEPHRVYGRFQRSGHEPQAIGVEGLGRVNHENASTPDVS